MWTTICPPPASTACSSWYCVGSSPARDGISESHRHVPPSSDESQTPTFAPGFQSCFPAYSRRPSASAIGPCGLLTGTRYGADHVSPPSVERSIHVSKSDFRCSGVVLRWTACHAGNFSIDASYASEVNVVTSNAPDGVSTIPASRSSIGVSSTTSGQLQFAPPSRDRISSTRPNGQTCASRPPEYATSSSPLRRRTAVGQPW